MNDPICFRPELIGPDVFLAPGAVVLGDVAVGARSSIWFGVVARGDTEAISIGQETNVQDLCVLHADPGYPCRIGSRVTVGHAAVVHGATIGDDCLVGMRAVVMNGAQIGRGSLIGAGCIVTERTIVPENSVVLGIPGKVVRETNPRILGKIEHAAKHYVQLAARYRAS
jgi:carbonic anhydrase/acetyltransferase-like protein (isoleucine patch superfamily)